jgi:hypothetical protein
MNKFVLIALLVALFAALTFASIPTNCATDDDCVTTSKIANSECDTTQAQGVCACSTNFYDSNTDATKAIVCSADKCAGATPVKCQDNATCNKADGSCLCNTGFHASGQDCFKDAPTCATAADCTTTDKNSTCDTTAKKCKCNTGFAFDIKAVCVAVCLFLIILLLLSHPFIIFSFKPFLFLLLFPSFLFLPFYYS